MDLTEKLDQGIATARAGNKKEARTLLAAVVEADETQLDAWLWLSQVVDSLEEKEICLDNILTLDPDNQFAQEELAQVKAAQDKLFAPTYAPGEEEPPPAVVTIPEAARTPIVDLYPHKNEFDNEWLCPYCIAPTRPKDRTCSSCRQPLIISRRVKEERTVWLWRSIFLQFTLTFFTIALGAGAFTLIVKFSGIPSPVPFLPLYFGQTVNQPQEFTQIVLAIFPRWVFWGLIGFSFYSFILMILLYLRVPYVNIAYLISGCVLLVMGIFGMIFFYGSYIGMTVGVIVLLIGVGQILLSYNLWDDFTFKEGRLRLKLDRDAKTTTTLFLSARKYIKLGMWGLAAIHLQQAAFRAPKTIAYHAALTMAYMKLNRYDLAQKALNNIKNFAPNALEAWQLQKELDALKDENKP